MPIGAWWCAIVLPLVAMTMLMGGRRRAYLRQHPNQRARARREFQREYRLVFWAGERTAYDVGAWNAALREDARYSGWWTSFVAPACALCIGGGLLWYALVGSHLTEGLRGFIWLASESLTLFLIVAVTLAYFIATSQARATRVALPVFEPERRGIVDYVSPVCWALWVALIALTLVAYVAAESPASFVHLTIMGYTHSWSPIEIAEISLLVSLFTLIAAAFAAQWIVTTPAVAGEAGGLTIALNDAHRAQAIGHLTLLPFELNVITLLLLTPGVASNDWVIFFLLWPLMAPLFIRIRATECRLGGRLTGWWWDLRPSPLARQTAESG